MRAGGAGVAEAGSNVTGGGGGGGGAANNVWKLFWSAQQRFFKLLCVGLKLDTVVAEVRALCFGGVLAMFWRCCLITCVPV